jgi:hypothetical protein
VVQDFIFVAGAASDWGARSDVMFPQTNYCPDDGRTSDHRPVLANLDTRGRAPVVTGSMPAREIRPFFPDTLITGSDAQIELADEPQPVPAALADPRTKAPDAAPSPPASIPAPVVERAGTGATERPSKDALLRRLERLEAEVRSLRREIEATPE